MKRIVYTLILGFVIANIASTQVFVDPVFPTKGMKSVKIFEKGQLQQILEYNKNGKLLLQTDYNPLAKVANFRYKQYNEQGQLVANIYAYDSSRPSIWRYDYSDTSQIIVSQATLKSYKPNSRKLNKLLESATSVDRLSEHKAVKKLLDKKGDIRTIIKLDENGRRLESYDVDKKGNRTLESLYEYRADGGYAILPVPPYESLIFDSEYYYDKNGNHVKSIMLVPEDVTVNGIADSTTYTYTETGRLDKSYRWKDGVGYLDEELFYNVDGNLKLSNRYSDDGFIIYKKEYWYEESQLVGSTWTSLRRFKTGEVSTKSQEWRYELEYY